MKPISATLLLAGLYFLSGCKPNIPDHYPVRLSDDIETSIADTNGFFKNASYSNSGGFVTNYDFGHAWDSLGSSEKKKRRLDSLEVIGFYEETSGVLHEQDTASFSGMVCELLKGCALSAETKAGLQKQLHEEYLAQTLFVGGKGCAVRNYKIGNENEYVSFRIFLCTTTVLTTIDKGTVTASTGNTSASPHATMSTSTSTAMPENVMAGKLGFKGMLVHVKPMEDKDALPTGYRKVNHHGLDLERAAMLYDTATVASPGAAIICLKL